MDEMSLDTFKQNIDNNYKLGLSIVAFTGGEPLVWKHLDEAIEYCTERNIFTQLTTNGTLLTDKRLDRFGKAGLDYLMVSIDSVKKKSYSKKTVSDKPDIINLLKYGRSKGMAVSWNTVLTRDNYKDVYELIEISGRERIPISIGVIVPSPDKKGGSATGNLELPSLPNNGLLKNIVRQMKHYKDAGYPIIEPQRYFEDIEKFLNGESVWDCSMAKERTVQVSPVSDIYWCSKLNLISPYKANSLDRREFSKFRKELADIIKGCNRNCYSNCGYNGYYLQKHKLYFLTSVLPLFLGSILRRLTKSADSLSLEKTADGCRYNPQIPDALANPL
jgi:MoaA/NifB/PqqE/SkfB family radical SAM enzyme